MSAGNTAFGVGRVLVVNRFYAKLSASTGESELYCDGNGKSGCAQPLVEGVERLRVKYWLAGAQTALDASALAPGQWGDVVAVDLCVLVRGAPPGRRSRYVDCDGASVTGADLRVRRAFWRRVAIRNNEVSASSRRALQVSEACTRARHEACEPYPPTLRAPVAPPYPSFC